MKAKIQDARLVYLFLTIPIVLLLGFFYTSQSQTMNEYCQTPPFTSSAIPPNVLMVIDASGSMSWASYYATWTSINVPQSYDPLQTYEGYFIPNMVYKKVNNVWIETIDAENCSLTYHAFYYGGGGIYNYYNWFTISGTCLGNKLNFALMTRIDLVRWAMTGGNPASCTGSKTFNVPYCDPELWDQSGNSGKVGSVCNDTIGGCKLQTYSGEQVKVPWSRVYDGLVFKFKNLSIRPRIGAMFYSASSVRSNKVYIGDFTSANSTDDQFPYMNLITHINSTTPSGATPTGPALWDALNYYAQNSPRYGGFTPQTGSGDRWKNPMYTCAQGGTNCVYVPCAKNFVILMSDGQWNYGGYPVSLTCSINTGYESNSADPVVPAYTMHMGFTNVASSNDTGTTINSNVSDVYSIGLFLAGTGEQSLKNVAMYGSFDNTGKTWPDNLSDYPKSTCGPVDDCCSGNNCGRGSQCTLLPSSTPDWDKDVNNVPDTFYKASTASGIKDVIMNAMLDILRRASSGTAVSVLASGEGSGANLLQAVFYPKRAFEQTEIDWIGQMQNLWYYLDPNLQYSAIREDTDTNNELHLLNDYVINFFFDTTESKAKAKRYQDIDGNGSPNTLIDIVDIDGVKNLWEAGKLLWQRDLSLSPRTIYTSINGTSFMSFSIANAGELQNYLQANSLAEATDIINYIHGIDNIAYRNRTVTISSVDNIPRVWKLSDIISSTPRLQSWVRLNAYNSEPPSGYRDETYQTFINSTDYKARGIVYVGANDGMLHAFKLGLPEMIKDPQNNKRVTKLCNDSNGDGKCSGETSADLGIEEWAYIPKNVLPYLKYLADSNYCHLYYVDATPYIFDASINMPAGCTGNYWDCDKSKTSWRTIIIGSMGLGGACRNLRSSCTNCVKTPLDGVGYSSYFAIDITDPKNPELLWEFSDPAVGFSTTGPVIIRTGNKSKNGRWFAVFASGPTGPIDTSANQFLGRSDQNLKLFILDLKTGVLLRTIDTGIHDAFGGSLINTTIDTDVWNPEWIGNYQDDVFYVGYVKGAGSTWTDGGVLRISTKESTDPSTWVHSTLIDGIGPVTTSIAHLQDRRNHKLWLYFGTGRFFYKIGTNIDDADTQQAIYGVKEPCYLSQDRFDSNCTSSVSSLTNTTTTQPTGEPTNGWYINLDASGASYKAERVITNPLAAFTGAVFFTTFSPSANICSFSGNTYVWAINYNTGWAAFSTALKGKALVQTSTGSIEELTLSSVFTQKDGRRTSAFQGVPPKAQGLSIVINPKPIKRILHIQER